MVDTQFFAQQGWQCPICKRVYSPTTSMCFYCGNTETVITTTTTIKTDNEQVDVQLSNGSLYAPELFNGCLKCDRHETCMDAFHSNAVNCNAYGKGTN